MYTILVERNNCETFQRLIFWITEEQTLHSVPSKSCSMKESLGFQNNFRTPFTFEVQVEMLIVYIIHLES